MNNKLYLEKDLPKYLQISIDTYVQSIKDKESGVDKTSWSDWWCDLNASINSAEVDEEITKEQAWYLREKYLGMEKNNL